MCCTTHDVMDALDTRRGTDVAALLAPSGDFRCQCPFGVPCKRAATAEDFLCDRCRGLDHQEWCDGNPGAYGPAGVLLGASWGDLTVPHGYGLPAGGFVIQGDFEFRLPETGTDVQAAVRYIAQRYGPGA